MGKGEKKMTIKEFLKTYGITILVVVIILGFISWWFPTSKIDKKCYRELALDICPDNQEMDYFDISNRYDFLYNGYDFSCCDKIGNETHRKVSDNYRHCENYKFIEEDDMKCSHKYRYWKKIY